MRDETIFLSYEDAETLVDRIAERAENFNYTMSNNEKESMSQLLSDIGVLVGDLVDVSRLADNYAINAEIVTPEDAEHYDNLEEDSLFSWTESDGTHYCYSW